MLTLRDIQLVIGDITEQPDCEAIVNAANPMLMRGAGVAGAIHKKAGKALEEFCEPHAPIETSEVFVSPAFNLPNKYVLHAVGPKYHQNSNPEELLEQTYINILDSCVTYKIETIAIPAISTGSYGFPLEQATLIAIETLLAWNNLTPAVVKLVVFDDETYKVYLNVIKSIDTEKKDIWKYFEEENRLTVDGESQFTNYFYRNDKSDSFRTNNHDFFIQCSIFFQLSKDEPKLSISEKLELTTKISSIISGHMIRELEVVGGNHSFKHYLLNTAKESQ